MIAGSRNSFIATLVERQSRYVMLVRVDKMASESVVATLARQIKHLTRVKHLPRDLRRSLTWDRGTEMANHKDLALATQIDIYFRDPKSPWQRGTNENTNRLLRQYFPKGTDLSVHSQPHLDALARELDDRPRKTSNYHSPAEKFDARGAAIG